jgi:predicted flavoprotein YhiN
MKTTLLLSIVVASASLWNVAELQAATERCDVLVYGGNAPGIVAGIQAARLGRRVIIVEPSKHLGGLTTGGLGATDTGRKQTVGGIAREFYEHVATHYAKPESWNYESADSPSAAGQEHTPDPIAQKNGRPTRWTFEPHVAMDIVRRMLADAKLTVRFEQRIASVKKNGARLAEVRMDDGHAYQVTKAI